MPYFTNTVPQDYTKNERLDKYIASLSDGMNRSKLKSGLVEILVNGKKQKISCKVKAGDIIDIQWEENIPDNISKEDIPLKIIYEDDNVTVVNKEQGMVTHPAAGNWTGTLVNALLYHWGREDIAELKDGTAADIMKNRRPGIVHRLDKDTSGVIITAKNLNTEEFLASQFRNHKTLVKEYIAICKGRPPKKFDIIRTQIIRDPRDRKRFKAVTGTEEGKFAETAYRCIACYGEYSLIRLRINTGRTHQIRVHMKYINCPILGDSIYSKPDKKFSSATLMLHSRMLKIHIPGKEDAFTFNARIPHRFKKIIKILHRDFSKITL